jgi:hypothetical protein
MIIEEAQVDKKRLDEILQRHSLKKESLKWLG